MDHGWLTNVIFFLFFPAKDCQEPKRARRETDVTMSDDYRAPDPMAT